MEMIEVKFVNKDCMRKIISMCESVREEKGYKENGERNFFFFCIISRF